MIRSLCKWAYAVKECPELEMRRDCKKCHLEIKDGCPADECALGYECNNDCTLFEEACCGN